MHGILKQSFSDFRPMLVDYGFIFKNVTDAFRMRAHHIPDVSFSQFLIGTAASKKLPEQMGILHFYFLK